jgi:hypothetical protein
MLDGRGLQEIPATRSTSAAMRGSSRPQTICHRKELGDVLRTTARQQGTIFAHGVDNASRGKDERKRKRTLICRAFTTLFKRWN